MTVSTILGQARLSSDCEGEEGERGERGKRGKRGRRGERGESGERGEKGERGSRGRRGDDGRDGDTGPTGTTGPTGPTGPTGTTGATGAPGLGGILAHVEDKSLDTVVLPPNSSTVVLTTPPIVAPVGSFVEITALVNYTNLGNTTGSTLVVAELDQDGVFLTSSAVTPGVLTTAQGTFDMSAPIPIVWHLPGDGLAHVYTVEVSTSPTTDGAQTARRRAIFVNVIAP